MINERVISEKFTVTWKQHFPLLTATFMKVFNESYVEKINSATVQNDDTDNVRYDFVSEAAFNLSKLVVLNKTTVQTYLSKKANIGYLVQYTFNENSKLGDGSSIPAEISVYELAQIKAIGTNILEFINIEKKDSVAFAPEIKGYGFIPNLLADLIIDNTLYEIKTVNRNFKSTDLKQLFIYLALLQVSGNLQSDYAGLYNPRRGTYCKFKIKGLVYNLTGKTTNETFENFLNSLIRDIQVDSKF
jgi:hypothetical protein